jgi:hypothetical protein
MHKTILLSVLVTAILAGGMVANSAKAMTAGPLATLKPAAAANSIQQAAVVCTWRGCVRTYRRPYGCVWVRGVRVCR